MIFMSRFREPLILATATLSLALLGVVGCAPPGGLQSGASDTAVDVHQVPFHDADATPSRPPDPSTPQNNGKSLAEPDLPFHGPQDHDSQSHSLQNLGPQSLPAGTLLTVRLENPISAENPDGTATFEAILDQPIVIDGNKLVPVGAQVSGRVESAQSSNLKRNRGYLRLTLASIQFGAVDVRVQTASLFVRGNAGQSQASQNQASESQALANPSLQNRSEAAATVIRLEKGHRLVFRLTEPVYVAGGPQAPADR
jgi:hypothetical protein